MLRMTFRIVPALVALGISACSGPIETHSGFSSSAKSSPSISAGNPVAVVGSAISGTLDNATKAAVIAAVEKRGQSVANDAPIRLTVSIAERAADMAILADNGVPLSRAKRRRLLQNCSDKTQRLVLVLERVDQPPLRAWAEESHCKAHISATLPFLAERAVDSLYRQSAAITLRSGQD